MKKERKRERKKTFKRKKKKKGKKYQEKESSKIMDNNYIFPEEKITLEEYTDIVLNVMYGVMPAEQYGDLKDDINSSILAITTFADYVFNNDINIKKIKRKHFIDFILVAFRHIDISGLILGLSVQIEVMYRDKIVEDWYAAELMEAIDIVCKLLTIYIEDEESYEVN